MNEHTHGKIIYYDDNGRIIREVTAADVARLERLVRIASAIIRSQPVGVPPRLLKAWREEENNVN